MEKRKGPGLLSSGFSGMRSQRDGCAVASRCAYWGGEKRNPHEAILARTKACPLEQRQDKVGAHLGVWMAPLTVLSEHMDRQEPHPEKLCRSEGTYCGTFKRASETKGMITGGELGSPK